MAANIFQNGGVDNNWGTIGNWSLGAVPTAADGNIATFDATSPNCTVNASARVCNAIDFTGYTNAITMTNTVTVSGNVTLDPAMDILGASNLIVNATGTLTSNGRNWNTGLTIAGTSQTYTLADDWIITDSLTMNATTQATLNGNNLSIASGWIQNLGNLVGTTKLIFNGTGSFTRTGSGSLQLDVDINTAGTITFVGTLSYGTKIFKYVSGTTVTTGSSLTVSSSFTGTTLDTNGSTSSSATTTSSTGINWNIVLGGAITVNSPLCIITRLDYTTGARILGTADIYLLGNLTVTAIGTAGSSSNIRIIKDCTWSGNFAVLQNIIIDTLGILTISGTISYNTGTLTVNKLWKLNAINTPILVCGTGSYISIDKLSLPTYTVTASNTLTMDKFFKGTLKQPTRVQSTTTSNYNVTFTGSDNKVTQFTNISNCTLTQKCRLIVASGANKGLNNGIIFGNTLPNGFALDGQVEAFRGFGDNQNNNGFVKVF